MVEVQLQLAESVNSFIQAQIAEGRYGSVDDYLSDLVRADQQQQELVDRLCQDEQVVSHIQQGLQSGAGRRWTPAVLDELRQQVVERDQDARNQA